MFTYVYSTLQKPAVIFFEPALEHSVHTVCVYPSRSLITDLEKAFSDFQCLQNVSHSLDRHSLDEWVGEEEHQGNHQTINGQGLHEGQGQQQHTSQVICHLRLARDAINASAGGNALANTRTDRSQANGEASANGRQSRDPDGALISKCCLWCHQSGRGQSCCGSSACSRSRHMGAARGRHEGGQECTTAQQHGTSQDERAGHGDRLGKLQHSSRCRGNCKWQQKRQRKRHVKTNNFAKSP